MKKWDEEQRLKQYNSKIQGIKPVLKQQIAKGSSNKLPKIPSNKNQLQQESQTQSNSNFTRALESAGSQFKRQISDLYKHEKEDINSIPLHNILKNYNLQQYSKELISRGYGYKMSKLANLNMKDFQFLCQELKILPGHKTKFQSMMQFMKENQQQPAFRQKRTATMPFALVQQQNVQLNRPQQLQVLRPNELSNNHSPVSCFNNLRRGSSNANNAKEPFKVTSNKVNKSEWSTKTTQFNDLNQQNQNQNLHSRMQIQNLGYDFFEDENNFENDPEFDKELRLIMNKYQDLDADLNNKQALRGLEIVQAQITTGIGQTATPMKDLNNNNTNNNYDQQKQYVKAKIIEAPAYQSKQKSKVLQRILKEIDVQDKKSAFSQDQSQNKSNSHIVAADKELGSINNHMKNIDNMYLSFERAKMTSTLANLDLEEMCHCLAKALAKHLEFGQLNVNQSFDQALDLFQLEQQQLNNKINTEVEGGGSAKEDLEESFFRSTLFNTHQNLNVSQQQQYNYQLQDSNEKEQDYINEKGTTDTPRMNIDSPSSLEYQQYQQYIMHTECDQMLAGNKEILHSQISCSQNANQTSRLGGSSVLQPDFSTIITNKHETQNQKQGQSLIKNQNQNEETQLITTKRDDIDIDMRTSRIHMMSADKQQMAKLLQSRTIFQSAFSDNAYTSQNQNQKYSQTTQLPNTNEIVNYSKNVMLSCKMEKEVVIAALIYIERLIVTSTFCITPTTWKRVLFVALCLASKTWDDESFENDNFSQAFPQFTTKEINRIETIFLQFIDYNLYVSPSEYAKYYFIMRTFAKQNLKSFPLRPLDLNTIMSLQNNPKGYRSRIKLQFINAVNKSY